MAGRHSAARRYADAARDIARADGTLDQWQADLHVVRDAFADERLGAFAESPSHSYVAKERALREAFDGRISREALNLILLLIRRGNVRAITPLTERFDELVRRERGISLAEVRTPMPLGPEERGAVEARLRELTGGAVEIREIIDESLIGGVAVRIGDRLYDASVRSRLERLRERLAAAGPRRTTAPEAA